MVFPIIKKVRKFIPDKLVSINKSANKIINLPENVEKHIFMLQKQLALRLDWLTPLKEQ